MFNVVDFNTASELADASRFVCRVLCSGELYSPRFQFTDATEIYWLLYMYVINGIVDMVSVVLNGLACVFSSLCWKRIICFELNSMQSNAN